MQDTTLEVFATLNALITRALPKAIDGLDIEEIICKCKGNDGKMSDFIRRSLVDLLTETEQPQPETTPPAPTPIHKDIRIEFELDGRLYEAVGFLGERESSVNGDEMLARTDKDKAVVDEEDYQYILKRQKKLPKVLDKYYLATKRLHHVSPRDVAYFRWGSGGWVRDWDCLGGQWDGHCLVLRRRT